MLFFLQLIDLSNLVFDISLLFLNFLVSLLRLGLEIHLEFLILLGVLLKGLHTLVELLLLHNDILIEELGLIRLVIYRYLSHEDLARVVNKVTHRFFLLAALV